MKVGKRRFTAGQLAQTLMAAIARCELKPGERLTEASLTQNFDVNRSTAREALRILETKGMATFQVNRGVRIARPEPEDAQDILRTRSLLYGLAVREFIANNDATARQQFHDNAIEFVNNSTNVDLVEFNQRRVVLVRRLLDQCGSPRLHELILNYTPALPSAFWPFWAHSEEDRQRNLNEWRNIAEGVRDNRSEDAERAIVRLHRGGIPRAIERYLELLAAG